eukprot:jgi/Tetstr1/427420/TSEL_017583.t2
MIDFACVSSTTPTWSNDPRWCTPGIAATEAEQGKMAADRASSASKTNLHREREDSGAAQRRAPEEGAYALRSREDEWKTFQSELRRVSALKAQRTAESDGNMPHWATATRAPLMHGFAPPDCTALTPILLSEVARRVNRIHTGRVLFARVVLPPYREVGTSVLLRDAAGDLAKACLYNCVGQHEEPDELYPEGTLLALMEPYMCHARDDPAAGDLLLRTDNPQTVVVFESEAEWMQARARAHGASPSPTPLRQEGDAAFEAGRLVQAERKYTAALRALPDSVPALNSRAQVRLRLESWTAALEDAEAVVALDPVNANGRLRLVHAMICLQRPTEALAALATARRETPPERQAELSADMAKLQAAGRRAEAEKRGSYDIQEMKAEAAGSPSMRLSRLHADFESPSIEVATLRGKGRGIVAAKDIPAGQLVMATKAFAFCKPPKEELTSCSGSGGAGGVDRGAQVNLLPEVVRSLCLHPESGGDLYALDAGGEFREAPPLAPGLASRVHVPRLEGILKNNWFSAGCCAGQQEVDTLLALHRWEDRANARRPPSEAAVTRHHKELESELADTACGLFLRPSLLNHSCQPNCEYGGVGDFLFVSTTRDVAAGEELCIAYLDILAPFAERRQQLSQGQGFQCACQRCAELHGDQTIVAAEAELAEAYSRGARLTATGEREAAASQQVLSKARRSELHSLFASRPLHARYGMVPLLDMEASICLATGRPQQALDRHRQILQLTVAALGERSSSVQLLTRRLRLANAACCAGQRAAAAQAITAAAEVFCGPPWCMMSPRRPGAAGH